LTKTWLPALRHPWVLDLDVTVKPLFGHQDGAELGYNPHKPGRPSHAYHTLMIRHLRLVFDVELHPGKEHAAGHGRSNLWRLWEGLPAKCRPALLCGDAAYGQEALLADCEARGQKYLFRQRQTQGVKQLIRALEAKGGWRSTIHRWEALEGTLRLSGWSRNRRIVVLRRTKVAEDRRPTALAGPEQEHPPELISEAQAPSYEHQILVTNLTLEALSLADLYRQRADSENALRRTQEPEGLGRVHVERPAAVPGGGAERRAGVQLVETVRVLRRSGARAGGHHEQAIVLERGGSNDPEREATATDVDQHPR